MENSLIPNTSATIKKKKSKLYKDSDSAVAVEKNANCSSSSSNNLEHSDKVTPIKVKRSFWKNLSHVFHFRSKRSEVPEFPNDAKVGVIPVTRLNAIFEEPKNSDDIDIEEIEHFKKTLQNDVDPEAELLQSNIEPLSLNTNKSDTNSEDLKVEIHKKTNKIPEYLSVDLSSSAENNYKQKLIQEINEIITEKELRKNDESLPKFIISDQTSLKDTKIDSLDAIADETIKIPSRNLVEEKLPSNQYSFEYSDTSEQSLEDICELIKEDVTSANKTEDQNIKQENHDQKLEDHPNKIIIQNLISKIDEADYTMHESLALATNFEKQYQIGMATMLDIKQELNKLSSCTLQLSKDSLDHAETETIKENEIINEMMYVIQSNMSILNDCKIDALQVLNDFKHKTDENSGRSLPASNSTGMKTDNEENATKFGPYFGQNSQIPFPLGMGYSRTNKEPMSITSRTQMEATTSSTKSATNFDNYSVIKPSLSLNSLKNPVAWNRELNELNELADVKVLVDNFARLIDDGIWKYSLDRFFKMAFDHNVFNHSIGCDPLSTGSSIGCRIVCPKPRENIIDEKDKVVKKRKMMLLLHNKSLFEKYIREYETEESDRNKDVTDEEKKIEMIEEKLEVVEENVVDKTPLNFSLNTSIDVSKNTSVNVSCSKTNLFSENDLLSSAMTSIDTEDTIQVLENTKCRLEKNVDQTNENKRKNCLFIDTYLDQYSFDNNLIEQFNYEGPVFEDIEELPNEDENDSQETFDELDPTNLDDLKQSTVEDLTVVRNVAEEDKVNRIKQNVYKQIEHDVQNLINELLENVHKLKEDCINSGVEVCKDNLIHISEIETNRIEIMNDINDILSNILNNVVTTSEIQNITKEEENISKNLQIFQQPNTSKNSDTVPGNYKTFLNFDQIENQPTRIVNNDSNSKEDIPKNLQNPQQSNTSKILDIVPEKNYLSFCFLQEFSQIENQSVTAKLDHTSSSNNYNSIKENTFGNSFNRTAGLNPEEPINHDNSIVDIVRINEDEEEMDGAYGVAAAAAVTQIHSIENDDKCTFTDFSNENINPSSTVPSIDMNLVLFDDEEYDETLFWDTCKQTQTQTQNSDSFVYLPRHTRYDYPESVDEEIIDFQILPNPQTELEFLQNNDRDLNQLPFLNQDQFDEAVLSTPLNSPSISTEAKLLHNCPSRSSVNSVKTLKNNFKNSKQNLNQQIYENIKTAELPNITDSLQNVFCDSFDEKMITKSNINEENDEDNKPGISYTQQDYVNSELQSSNYTNNNSVVNTSEKSDSDQFKTIVSKKFSRSTDNSVLNHILLDVTHFGAGTSSFSECPMREKLLLQRKCPETNLSAAVQQVPSLHESIEHRFADINLPIPVSARHFITEKIINIPQTITHDNIVQSTNFIQKNSKKLPIKRKIEPLTKITDELQNINAHIKETMEAMNKKTLDMLINPSINSLSMSGSLSILSTISANYNEVFPNTSKAKKVKREENAENSMIPLSASKILQSKKESATSSSNSVKIPPSKKTTHPYLPKKK